MPSKSKAKGSGYERDVAKFLSELYKESFIRVPNSGAFIGGINSKRKEILHEGQIRSFKGDIIPGESFPKMNLECKFYSDFPFHQLFSGNVKILDAWIEQCMAVADAGDFNLLCLKFNRKGQYVVFESHNKLQRKNELVYSSSKYHDWVIMDHATFWSLNSEAVKILCGSENSTK